jgi:hypothetical protein
MKTLTVRLNKAVIDNDIDHRTYKRSEASLQTMPEVSRDAAASDTTEGHDGSIVTRYRDLRDAMLRKRLIRYLTNELDTTEFTNLPRTENAEYVYTFSVPDDFRTELMAAIKDQMHEYIIRGTIYDWYKYAGLPTMDTDLSLEEMENDILNALRGKPNATTRPLQPFGPPFPKTPLF